MSRAQVRIAHLEPVDEGAVAAAEVAQARAGRLDQDLAMEARYRSIGQHQVIELVRANRDPIVAGSIGSSTIGSEADLERDALNPEARALVAESSRSAARAAVAERRRGARATVAGLAARCVAFGW
jgi:hypothetical protein